MQMILNIRMLSVRAALLTVLAAGLMLPVAHAQSANQNQKPNNKTTSSAKGHLSAGESADNANGAAKKEHVGDPQQGIKVHGHWAIDVHNPDGSFVSHSEFDNSYVDDNSLLPKLLARTVSLGMWHIELSGPCSAGSSHVCYVSESQSTDINPPFGGPNEFKNLSVTTTASQFVLSGSATAQIPGTIQSVGTLLMSCPNNIAPATTCTQPVPGSIYTNFTSATGPGTSFVTNQIIQVTVTITFS